MTPDSYSSARQFPLPLRNSLLHRQLSPLPFGAPFLPFARSPLVTAPPFWRTVADAAASEDTTAILFCFFFPSPLYEPITGTASRTLATSVPLVTRPRGPPLPPSRYFGRGVAKRRGLWNHPSPFFSEKTLREHHSLRGRAVFPLF